MYQSVTGPLIQAVRITDPEKKKIAISFIVDLIKNDKGIEKLFWEEYKQLERYVGYFLWVNVPELFHEN